MKLYERKEDLDFDLIEDNLIFYTEYLRCGDTNGFTLPLKYLWMSEKEILKEINNN